MFPIHAFRHKTNMTEPRIRALQAKWKPRLARSLSSSEARATTIGFPPWLEERMLLLDKGQRGELAISQECISALQCKVQLHEPAHEALEWTNNSRDRAVTTTWQRLSDMETSELEQLKPHEPVLQNQCACCHHSKEPEPANVNADRIVHTRQPHPQPHPQQQQEERDVRGYATVASHRPPIAATADDADAKANDAFITTLAVLIVVASVIGVWFAADDRRPRFRR